MQKKLNNNTKMIILLPAVLLIIQALFLVFAMEAGRGALYLRVSCAVWICILLLYTIAVFLTHTAQAREFSLSVMLIVIFSGVLMTIGSLTQVLLIGHLNAQSNASKYIVYEILQYAKGEAGSNILHSEEGEDGTIDTFMTTEVAKALIEAMAEDGISLTRRKTITIDADHPLLEGETADENGRVTRVETVAANYQISASDAKAAIAYLTDNERFPQFSSVLAEETAIRERREANSQVKNYIEALIGGLLLVLLLLFMHGHYYDYYLWGLLAIEVIFFILLLLVGTGSDGASISLGGFQPLEFFKVIYVFVLAALLCKPEKADVGIRFPLRIKGKEIVIPRYAAAVGFIGFNALGYMACGELGTLLVIGCVGLCMILIFCESRLYRLGTFLAAAGGFGLLFLMGHYRITYLGVKLYNRFHYFFNPGASPEKYGYQYIQLKESLSVSGWFGASERYAFHISQEENDMVFAALVQQRGIFYGILVILMFAGLLMVSYRAALRAQDTYYRGLGIGCCLIFGFQGLVHISYNVGIFPITGVPLMYISDGGSNMAVSMMFTVLLIVISSNHMQRAVSDEEEVDALTGGPVKKFIEVIRHSFSNSWF